LAKLHQATFGYKDGAVVEIDIRKYFNSIPHGPLSEMLEKKISDSRILKLLRVLMKAATIADGKIEKNEQGSPHQRFRREPITGSQN